MARKKGSTEGIASLEAEIGKGFTKHAALNNISGAGEGKVAKPKKAKKAVTKVRGMKKPKKSY